MEGQIKNTMKQTIAFALLFLSLPFLADAQETDLPRSRDSLAGSDHAGRNWWDLQHYTIDITPDIAGKSLSGSVKIVYKVLSPGEKMMIDLQQPLKITRITGGGRDIPFTADDRFWWLDHNGKGKVGTLDSIQIFYEGKPREAVNPPWDGGLIWKKDNEGRPWITTACQGIGASIWWPCKDIQSDEPDRGVDILFTVPEELTAVSNGKLAGISDVGDHLKKWHWRVTQPINNYSIAMNLAHYTLISDVYEGKKGKLDVGFYVLDYNLEKGKKLFPEIMTMLQCFEDRIGPYPFYEDGYKMVETSHLGMEHQSGIAYGNKFLRGYLGSDRSRTGVGLGWDFILVHESGHEWFGNSITALDINDNWIHEGFTTYLETIYTECVAGKEAARKYLIGQRHIISNKQPLINDYGVNYDAPGDIYDKGASLIHTIRTLIDDDPKFFRILQALNEKYYHSIVTTKDIEDFLTRQSGLRLQPVFDQYLRTTQIPVLEYTVHDKTMTLQWTNVIKGFKMPVLMILKDGSRKWITASEYPVSVRLGGSFDSWDPNIYCTYKEVK